MTGWPETDALLERFRDWLDQVREESRIASAEPPAHTSEVAGSEGSLQSFRHPPLQPEPNGAAPSDAGDFGLVNLVREFTALRHEIKLQTKSGRGLEEQIVAAIAAMEEAGRQFRAVGPQEAEAARRAALPLIESLADLDEAVGRAQAVVESARGRLGGDSQAALRLRLANLFAAQPAWKRWLCRSWYAAAGDLWLNDADDRKRIVDALSEGYGMVRKRLQRAMAKENLYRMASLGQPVEIPHAMTVVEVVDAEDHQAPGTVVEEIRPGYRWNGKVVRFAEVRAARNITQVEA